jgi:geranylgeranyl pyrophosphate synthase
VKLGALREIFAPQIREVDEALAMYVNGLRDPMSHYDMVRYHLGFADGGSRLPSGKRLRPLFSLFIGRACGAPEPVIRKLMIAVEISHNASLVHDDIEDGDPIRWGRPTTWSVYGMNQAINVGDALIGMTYEVLMAIRDAGVPADTTLRVLEIFNRTHLRMAEGQHLDLLHEGRFDIGVDAYLDIISRKTAAACECAAHAAAVLAGQSPVVEDCYRRFGHAFGMLYQLCDDIRALWGEPEDTGKAALRDIALGKSTLPLIYGMELGTPALREALALRRALPAERRHSPAAPRRLPDSFLDRALFVRDELTKLGVDDLCRKHVVTHRDRAIAALRETKRNSEEHGLLETMTKLCAEMAGVRS